jgi:hypothetical protein
VNAQITFSASEMLTIIGDYSQEYITTNTNPSGIIGPTGGPQVWNFSSVPAADYVRRLDIVPPTDAGYQASFPNATYAERYTDPVSIFQEWDYCNLTTNAGRIYYGSYDASSGTQVFSPPPTDIPAILGYGSNWSYTCNTTLSPYTVTDTVTNSVDAYGTVVLPQIGQVQALRVNELTEQLLVWSGIRITNYIREYFWLVPGIGKAVDIVSSESSTPPPASFTSADEVRRVFEINSSVSNLRLQVQKGLASLCWLPATNAAGYQVRAIGGLTMTNWQILASPVSNSWSEAVTATQRFYRVFIEP